MCGCGNSPPDDAKKAITSTRLSFLSGFHITDVLWGAEYDYWNPLICFAGDCPVRTWTWCVRLKAESEYVALEGFEYIYSQRLLTQRGPYTMSIITPGSFGDREPERLQLLEKHKTERDRYFNDFSFYVYKLVEAEAESDEKRGAVKNEITQKLTSGVPIKVSYRRGENDSR